MYERVPVESWLQLQYGSSMSLVSDDLSVKVLLLAFPAPKCDEKTGVKGEN